MAKRRGKNMSADTSGSSAFDELIYQGGNVFATFTDGTQEIYPMSRAEAEDWFEDDSLGGYFNSQVR